MNKFESNKSSISKTDFYHFNFLLNRNLKLNDRPFGHYSRAHVELILNQNLKMSAVFVQNLLNENVTRARAFIHNLKFVSSYFKPIFFFSHVFEYWMIGDERRDVYMYSKERKPF